MAPLEGHCDEQRWTNASASADEPSVGVDQTRIAQKPCPNGYPLAVI
jgi:hypothetical protein